MAPINLCQNILLPTVQFRAVVRLRAHLCFCTSIIPFTVKSILDEISLFRKMSPWNLHLSKHVSSPFNSAHSLKQVSELPNLKLLGLRSSISDLCRQSLNSILCCQNTSSMNET
ncbi:hypothetical protein K1719_012092 [Acacia pycnantha]|nr:hypothetical protein K1719_012092 [Acacia pycnantha]